MNINLLPDKFVKNKAFDIILIGSGFTAIMVVLMLIFLFLFYQLNVTKYTNQVNSQLMEKALLGKKVKELQQSQLVDLQGAVSNLKQEQKLAASVMANFSEVAKSVDVIMLSYELLLDEPAEQNTQDVLAGDGSKLLPSLTIRVRGDFYTGGVRFKEAIEKIEWVYDCKPVSITKEADFSESDYIVRLKKEEVPMISRMEKAQDD
ncbi:hypothetical protein I6N95_17280 [Vagococcus sp. BWB3-3]|uniref:Uncharacterized protein n=1 Tax=Vagococcus allomyrinae TaxID=2794353 RepID=A0A940PH26_9ENTE|nr:hypothetical protein [Vagococcus allomyrinae]MBP1042773.1 hypothetical protein [Vagococcus allomyrinae]